MQMRWIDGSIGNTFRGRKVIGEGKHPPAGRESWSFFVGIGDTGGGILFCYRNAHYRFPSK